MLRPPILEIHDLSIHFQSDMEKIPAVKGMNLYLHAGETVALVGESGSGKSVTALSVMRLLPESARITSGRILFRGEDVAAMDEASLLGLRGNEVAMIFQEPMTALNPVYPIGQQLIEPLLLHQGMTREEARAEAISLLFTTGIDEPERRLDSYPHQLSGGQRQRVLIAMGLACNPKLLIADEPTTALDVTIQAQILDLLQRLQKERSLALLLISHDLPMVRRMADRVYVMEKGELKESAPCQELFDNPQDPYTIRLLNALPSSVPPAPGQDPRVIYEAEGLKVHFPVRGGIFRRVRGVVKAVDGVDLVLRRGETVGVVGESGSGKTTLAEALLRLVPSQGRLSFDGIDMQQASRDALRVLRRRMQVVFQDPFSSLSPRMTVGRIMDEGLAVHQPRMEKGERAALVARTLAEVGLDGEGMLDRYPHEFSGGQRQRIAIARAMVLRPDVLVLDEPTSALDLSVQEQILGLLRRLQVDYQLSYLFISHDLRVIRSVSHEVLVMYQGRVVERGSAGKIFDHPEQEYTKRLMAAALGLA